MSTEEKLKLAIEALEDVLGTSYIDDAHETAEEALKALSVDLSKFS
jgi:hypothetical protein